MVTNRNQLYPSQGVVPSQDTRVAVADRVAKQGREQKHQGGGEGGKVKTDYTLTKGEKKRSDSYWEIDTFPVPVKWFYF